MLEGKTIASFGMFVILEQGLYRTRGSRMASGNFTTKPMMLLVTEKKNMIESTIDIFASLI